MCGFFKESNAELCGRWMQLSAFYPFARNHYNRTDVIPQEPYAFDEKTTNTSRLAVMQRYSFLRYFYTKLFETSQFVSIKYD